MARRTKHTMSRRLQPLQVGVARQVGIVGRGGRNGGPAGTSGGAVDRSARQSACDIAATVRTDEEATSDGTVIAQRARQAASLEQSALLSGQSDALRAGGQSQADA